MSVVALRKVTVFGPAADRDRTLATLQELGCLHLVSLRPPPAEPETAPPARPEDAYRALKYLMACRDKRLALMEDEAFEVDGFVERVLHNERRAREAADRRDFLQQRIRLVEPWGDFRLPPLNSLGGNRLWFYRVPHYRMAAVAASGLTWQAVHRGNRNTYVVVVAPEEPPAAAMPVPRAHLGAVSLSQLRHHLRQAQMELEELADERRSLTRWLWLLAQNLARAEDRAALAHAASLTLERDGIFAVQGWAPLRDLARVRDAADALGLAVLSERPRPGEQPPTLLENAEGVGGGEEIVAFYEVPGYRSWDPSPVIFVSFALFFAMILADAGYAAVLGALLLPARGRLARSPRGARVWRLGAAACAAAVAYGVLAGNYFGAPPAEGSLPAALQLIDVADFQTMMRISVTVGVTHLAVANAALAWRARHTTAALAPAGWIAALAGGLAWWQGWAAGPWLLGLGLALVLAFSGRRRGSGAGAWLWRLLDGLLALTGVSKAFGDVISYLRLFALGLASASLAVTFNRLAFGALDAFPGIGVLVCVLILVLGHGLNLVLALMSGVVHGLRLNLIELYHWGVLEEGHPFHAFAKKEKRPWRA